VLHRIEIAQLRHDPWKNVSSAKRLPYLFTTMVCGLPQLHDPGMYAQARLAGLVRRDGVGQHHPQAVLYLVQDAAISAP